MKKYLYLISFISLQTLAQTTTLTGIIKDKETSLPVENVVVSIEKTNNHTITDASGYFSFISINAGTFEIDINKLGYEKQKKTITLAASDTNQLVFLIERVAAKLQAVDISIDKPVSAASSKYLSQIDFENRPKNSAQDMLRLVPGLFIAQHAGGGKAEQIFIRGFDCDHGTDVATYVDGMPVNMPSHGHGQGYEDLHFLIPETVEGMEIFKGPYSPRFGDFATGAAVQFNTLDSLEHNLIQLETGYVPNNKNITSNRGLALLQLPDIGTNVTSYFAADVINNRGYFEKSQDFNRVSLFSKTTVAVTDHSHIHFSIGGFGSSWNASGQVPERAVAEGIISRFGSIDNTEGGTTQRNNFSVIYHTQIEATEFETQVYTSDYRFKLFSNFTFFLNDPVNGDEIEQDDNRTIRGVNAHYTFGHKLGNLNNKFTIGTSYRADNIENQLWHAVARTRLEARALALVHERSAGVFANEVFRFSDQFRIELGARYDYFIFDVEDLLPTDSFHVNYSGYNYQTLLSPKLNMIYSPTDRVQLFLNAGSGFHSNDARSVVQQPNEHELPRAIGAEAGSLFHIGQGFVISGALWWMDVENELVYVGDDGTTENKGPSRRTGIDLSARLQINKWLFADADLNLSKNIFIDKLYGTQLQTGYYLPLAPTFTSAGGLAAKFKNGVEAGARYRFLAKRPANESNTVSTRGYNIVDFTFNYHTKNYRLGLIAENLLNVEWNEAQFDTESRLFNETQSVDELHCTPGTPFSAKIVLGYIF